MFKGNCPYHINLKLTIMLLLSGEIVQVLTIEFFNKGKSPLQTKIDGRKKKFFDFFLVAHIFRKL